MKGMRKLSAILLVVMLCVGIVNIPVFAATTSQDRLEVTLTTDKDEYSQDEEITATLTVKNTNDFAVSNVSWEGIIPEGYELAEGTEATGNVDTLEAGKTLEVTVTYVAVDDGDFGEDESTEPTTPESGDDNKEADKKEDSSVDTGDKNNIVLYSVMLFGALGVIIVISINKKRGRNILSILLCITIVGASGVWPSIKVDAAGADAKKIEIQEVIQVDGKDVMLKAMVSYQCLNDEESVVPEEDKDADDVNDYMEELFGTNDESDDTDGDGLTDYVEIYETETDPTSKDTDSNGILDCDEDADSDGLSNAEELKLGTDVTKEDSDNDGLTDSDELNVYKTDPIKKDTDGDGISDGDEILLGMDPLNKCTDGVTPDAERTFEQELNNNNVDSELSNDNEVTPSISGNVPGNINKHVTIEEADIYALEDNRAAIGKQVCIETDYPAESDLMLEFDCSKISERVGFLMICRYEDGEIIPCDTEQSEDTISAKVTTGYYFVIDAEKLLVDLDIPIEKYLSSGVEVAAFSLEEEVVANSTNEVSSEWYAENYTLVDESGVPVDEEALSTLENDEQYMLSSSLNRPALMAETAGEITSTISGQADIVFVIDSTGSMSGAINNVVANIEAFVDALASNYSVKANFALVDYKDITCEGEETVLVKNGSSNWYNNTALFKQQIASIYVTGGGDTPETAIDGLAMANSLDFRQTANKFVILVTDAGYKNDNNYGVSSMEQMADMMSESGIVTSVISNTYYESDYNDLYTSTNGVFGDIYGDFSTVLLKLADNIGEIVNDGSWVILKDYQYLKLDQPLENSSYSSDSDKLSDYEELGKAIEKDLTDYINKVLECYGVPKELYKDQTTITVYDYTSNPLIPDTDYDGINDDRESKSLRMNNDFEGLMHYELDDKAKTCNVEFTVDYSKLFKSNTAYYKDLAVLSVLYASDIYKDNYIEVTKGTKGGSDNAVTFGGLFGLDDVEDIKINASDYSVDKDDITEIVIGHREVEYRGETKEIIILSVRGTNGTNAEWSSNFDVGADTTEYYNAVGTEHPDWKNKENHKGFDVATNRVLDKVNKYLKTHNLDGADVSKTILITGHSRGAAIANLLGAHFENDSAFKSFTYTFAAPFTTTDTKATSYKTIKNVMNTDDLVPYLPLEGWGFEKYGTMYEISVADNYENKWGSSEEGTFEWLVGYDYNNDGGTERTINSFLKIADNRADLYKIDNSDDAKVNIDNKYYSGKNSTEDVAAEKARIEKLFKEAKLKRFCNISVKGTTIKHVEVNYSPAYLMQNLANMASGVGPKIGYDTKGVYASAKASFVASSGFIPGGLIGGMTHPHQQPTYYLLAYNNFKSIK